MKHGSTGRKILIKFFKIVGWIVFSIIFLLIAVALLIQIPAIQNKITQKAIGFLQDKIGTEVRLDHISLSFPKKIVLTGLYLEDQRRDTLLYAGRFAVDTDLWALTKNEIQLNTIELEDFDANLSRSEKDSAFNFDYIIEAFNDSTAVKEKDTTAAAWAISVEDIDFKKINIDFKDSLEGNDVELRVGEFDLSMDDFDLEKSVIKVDEISLADVRANVTQTKVPEMAVDSVDVLAKEPEAFPYNVGFNTITLENIAANYNHTGTGQVVKLDLRDAMVEANEINMADQIIKLEKFDLENTFLSYQQMPISKPKKAEVTAEKEKKKNEKDNKPWVISLNELSLVDNVIQFYDFNKPVEKGAVDFNHLWISGLNADAENISLEGSNVRASLNDFTLHEKSGFTVAEFKGDVALTDQHLTLNDFLFRTGSSKIAMNVKADFKSLAEIVNNYPHAKFDFRIKQSVISLRDILYLSPNLLDSLSLHLSPSSKINVDAYAHGAVNNLTVEHLFIDALNNTNLKAHGFVRGLPDMKKAFMDLSIDKLYSTRKDLQGILPDSLIPASIQVPEWVNVAGHFKGTTTGPEVNTTLTSSFGSMDIAAKMNLDSSYDKENYNAQLNINKFALGKLLKQDSIMGNLDMQASIKGKGLKIDNLDALLNVKINEFVYNDYAYRDFNLEGTMKKYFFSGKAGITDENINMKLEGDFDYNKDVPHYKFTFDLVNADFKALHLTPRPLKARGTIDVNMATADMRILNGKVDIRKFAMYNGSSLYAVDSLLFASIDQKGKSEISIRSDILSGDFKGTINLFTLPEVLSRHFNQYFSLHDTAYATKSVDVQNFKFNMVIKNTDLITEILLPGLDPFVPGKIAGEFNSLEDRLVLDLSLAKIKYSGVSVDSIWFKVLSDKNSLDYTFALEKIGMDTMKISALRLAGNIMNDSIHSNFMILDSLRKEKYFLGGVINSNKDDFEFRFIPGQVTMNYDNWKVPMYNTLRITKHGLVPNDFHISKGDERILLLKRDDRDSTLSVVFNKVDLKNITSIVEGATPAGGIINGDLNIAAAQAGAFNSKLNINEFTLFEQPWGDLSVALGKTSVGPLNLDVRIEGKNANVQSAGYITSDSLAQIHLVTNINKFNLAIAEPLTFGQLKDLKGQLVGEVKMSGLTSKPDIDGVISFKQTSFIATYVNSAFLLEDEAIHVKNSGIELENFEILDNQKNKAVLDGSVSTNTDAGVAFDLDLNAKNFQVVNTKEGENELFYGLAKINTSTHVGGTAMLPEIKSEVSLSEDTNLTYIVPQSEKGVMEQKGIVVFIDKDAKNDSFLKSINPSDTIKSTFTGIDLTANIELSDKEAFNIVIDPVTGDKLSIKGNSTLTMKMDPSGDMQLSGRYEISEGSYDLSFYKLVKRKFLIDKGSAIVWAGDPLNATMDIRAIYNVEAAPLELMTNQTNGSADELNIYKERVPFQVYLQIKGQLLAPEISFKLDMPQDAQNSFGGNVYARVRDINTRESDLNKQVFALLVLQRFISDNPFDNNTGGDVESSARRSVSKILSDQLNRLSQNVKGVELSFDLKSSEDYSTGTGRDQTALELGLSKSLMNDRLVVKVSGNVGLEGEKATNQNSVADFIGDLALEYKLTDDGRFRITGFRNSNYDMIDGDLIETGAGLIYIKDYDTLRELFKSNAKKQ